MLNNKYNKDLKEKKIAYICKNEYKYFLKKANVFGIALGYKRIKSFYTREKCITVFVLQKICNDKLISHDRIPTVYKGIKTDVVQRGPLVATELKNKIRPAIGGYSISSIAYENGSGSLGGIVTDGKDYYVLSNNHVLAGENTIPINTPIIQPSLSDKGNRRTDLIAILSKYIPVKFIKGIKENENYVDCAIGKVLNKKDVSCEIAFVGKPQGVIVPRLNQKVKKVGRSSELTTGVITELYGTFTMDGVFVHKRSLFVDQIISNMIVIPGDSGSLLLDERNYVLGLTMGSDDECSAFNPINTVLRGLNVRLVTD